jgi:catechol-2,3-dioxygenase
MKYGSPSGPFPQNTINDASGGRREMAEWEKQIFAINLIVGDLERSKAFYQEVFGLAHLDEEDELEIFRLTDTFVALRHD